MTSSRSKASPAPLVRTLPVAPPSDSGARFSDPDWLALDFDELKKLMQGQRERQPRIRVPMWEEVIKQLPPKDVPSKPVRIKWSLVCMGFQPRLAQGWGACTKAFRQEAEQDRVFEECLFWVVTRSLQCFY